MTAPPAELVTVQCRCTKHPHCVWAGVPFLVYYTITNQLGAYCWLCKCWIKWVPQNAAWSQQFAHQQHGRPPVVEIDNSEVPGGLEDRIVTAVPTIPTIAESAILHRKDVLIGVAQECWFIAEDHGWHTEPRSTLERAMLVVTEMAELSESARHGTLQSPSEHIPEHTQAAEEWADSIIRAFDHSAEDGVTSEQLIEALFAKMEYNRSRPFRHGGKTI